MLPWLSGSVCTYRPVAQGLIPKHDICTFFHLDLNCDEKRTKISKMRPALASYTKYFVRYWMTLGGSPGLVVMGGDSCSKGYGFKSQRRIYLLYKF